MLSDIEYVKRYSYSLTDNKHPPGNRTMNNSGGNNEDSARKSIVLNPADCTLEPNAISDRDRKEVTNEIVKEKEENEEEEEGFGLGALFGTDDC